MTTSTLQWLALSQLPNVGPVTIKRWLSRFHHINQLMTASSHELKEAGLSHQHIQALQHIDWKKTEAYYHSVKQGGCQLITWDDVHYPPLLREIHDPPLLLYAQGNVSLLKQLQFAIVGSRHPTSLGTDIATQFAAELSRAGCVITSGLAIGIDAASHRGALTANGKTIAVLGSGLHYIYPRQHQSLAKHILSEEGALLSEFPLHSPPKPAHFLIRNRIISGLSVGVLVVEAAMKSGSLVTARLALEQNREVFAIPGALYNPLTKGCHALIRQGATLVETVHDILSELERFISSSTDITPSPIKVSLDLDPLLQRVFTQIGYEVTTLDAIMAGSGLTTSEVSSMLLTLELEGYIRSITGGYVRIVK